MTDTENVYVEPKNHPGIKVDMSYGQCACFMCRDIRVTNQERDRILKLLAADVLRKDAHKADEWLSDWAMRHGSVAYYMLQEHIDRARRNGVLSLSNNRGSK